MDNYEYSIILRTGVYGTNRNGSITKTYDNGFDNYIYLYNNKPSRNGIVTYKDYIGIFIRFIPKVINQEEFDDFFEDGMTKLNSLLERYNIIFPVRKISTHRDNRDFFYYYSFEILGEEKEIIVEFS